MRTASFWRTLSFWLCLTTAALAADLHRDTLAGYESRLGPAQARMDTSETETTYIWSGTDCLDRYLTTDRRGRVVAEGVSCACRGLVPAQFPQPAFLATTRVVNRIRQGSQRSWRIVETLAGGVRVSKAYDAGRLFAVTVRYPK